MKRRKDSLICGRLRCFEFIPLFSTSLGSRMLLVSVVIVIFMILDMFEFEF